ncbi:heterodisulfide reductase-related iron-sulfur binding cluster [Nocardioides sediminis]|uniref:heterodisulfide reductase-related iron-sulfur binding cluster n=1 Tax=Nocardioides sediminis TaxID=433648 RepID=UPI000D309481|nr:heterodisulfide reductase-related iron-sulfur binding cluster [Nocardioides sediminis]
MQIIAIVVSLAITAVAVGLAVQAVRSMLGVIRTGQPDGTRSDQPGRRLATMFKETLGHTRMLQWTWIGVMHWFVFAGFIFLSSLVFGAYLLIFDAHQAFPVIGTWIVYEWPVELLSWLTLIGIVYLIAVRQKNHPRSLGRKSRFFGSTFWQAYFVEAVILSVVLLGIVLRTIEYALLNNASYVADHPEAAEHNGLLHFPTTAWLGQLWSGLSLGTLENLVYLLAMVKIVVSMTWLIVIARNISMGVAWHRFTAWFNIFYKRESDGSTALGAMKPLTSAGVPVTLDDIEDLDEDSTLGVGKVEDFSWKGMLDFTTCTECGRCQSQCPAWNTEKPLSPKLLVLGLRDHAYAKAPYVQAGGEDSATATALLEEDEVLAREAARPLVGDTGDEWFYMPEDGSAVIDSDVLWNCTSCGACVQQCPVDIEHVDHIMDMRRYQVLVEANFPAELNQLFKGLENKGNPWNMSSSARMDWAKGLDFEVPVVGEDLESLESVDWLFWVGCAGAYEDRAKKTTRAVAELLDMAGISFGVLGNGETCTGDPARRAGNEFVFQGLAAQNVETFKEYKVKKVVSTCAHCFNTLKNEYKDFGIELEVVHHTQLLNRLVREGKLTPIKDGAGAAKRSITYHDPCYLGRHNQVYSPPRELLQILPGAEFTEMERNSEKSFCCGAGGARMWMEENIGERINLNRTKEAVGTGADQIAVGCPFCRVMLSDGLTAEQAKGNAREEVEILDVAQMLLASVKGESATKAGPGTSSSGSGGTTPAPAAAAAAGSADTDVATKAEPEPGDVTTTEDTVTETADAGPAAKASGGSSLFDVEEPSAAAAPEKSVAETPADATHAPAAPAQGSGSLFDLDEPADKSAAAEPETVAEAPAAEKPAPAKPSADLGSGGSLFDLDAPADSASAKAETADAPTEPVAAEKSAPAKPAADLGSGGSLFDLTPEEPAKAAEPAAPAKAEPTPAPAPAAEAPAAEPAAPAPDLGSGSLFDIAAEPAPSGEPATSTTSPKVADAPTADTDTADTPAGGEPATSAPTAKVADAPATSGQASTPATSIPEGGSLFDIEAPTPTAAPAAPATSDATTSDEAAAPATGTSDVPTEAPATSDEAAAPATGTSDVPEQAEGLAGGAALSQAATFAAADEAGEQAAAPAEAPTRAETSDDGVAPTAEASDVPEDAPAEATDQPEQPKPSSDGAAHTPRTDVDIDESGSLFDL